MVLWNTTEQVTLVFKLQIASGAECRHVPRAVNHVKLIFRDRNIVETSLQPYEHRHSVLH